MGQSDIYALLKKYPNKKFNSKELAKKLQLTHSSLTNSLRKMRETIAKNDSKMRFKKHSDGRYWSYLYWYNPRAKKPCKKNE